MSPDATDNRPVLDLAPTPQETSLAVLSAAAMVLMVALLLVVWPQLPEQVPMHFNFAGVPDAWGSRAWLAGMPVLAVGTHVLFQLLMARPHRHNYPWPITAENAEAEHRLSRSLISWLRLEVVCLFGVILWYQVRVAMQQAHGLDTGSVWSMTGLVIATSAVHLVLMYRVR